MELFFLPDTNDFLNTAGVKTACLINADEPDEEKRLLHRFNTQISAKIVLAQFVVKGELDFLTAHKLYTEACKVLNIKDIKELIETVIEFCVQADVEPPRKDELLFIECDDPSCPYEVLKHGHIIKKGEPRKADVLVLDIIIIQLMTLSKLNRISTREAINIIKQAALFGVAHTKEDMPVITYEDDEENEEETQDLEGDNIVLSGKLDPKDIN